uniref:Band 3 cytoplasmic domain-containing protein n=1 Tax=Petromyzon marinus TaxID=7757 RepID=S4RGQ5_PETMA
MEDEAVVDRGYVYQKHKCDDEEVEGRLGPLGGGEQTEVYNFSLQHKKKCSHRTSSFVRSSSERCQKRRYVMPLKGSSGYLLDPVRSPSAERVRYILGDEEDVRTPQLFTELDELAMDGDEMEWKETARWLKFEEKVEEGGERWSKPHVATLSLHSLFELRTCLQSGTVLLDLEAYSLPQIIECITERQIVDGLLRPDQRDQVTFTLLRRHRHQTKKSNLRSLADIGKSVSGSSKLLPHPRCHSPGLSRRSLGIGIGSLNDISDMPGKEQMTNKFMKKIPRDAEASNVLVGELELLERPLVAFVRLQQAVMLGSLTEVPVPTRFLLLIV